MQTRVVPRLPHPVCFLYSEISCVVSLKSTLAGLSPSHPQPTLFPASAPSLLAGGGWWTRGRRGTTAYCVGMTLGQFISLHRTTHSSRLCPSPAQAEEPPHTTKYKHLLQWLSIQSKHGQGFSWTLPWIHYWNMLLRHDFILYPCSQLGKTAYYTSLIR